jgi:hypothetical protein
LRRCEQLRRLSVSVRPMRWSKRVKLSQLVWVTKTALRS